jgi:hypothetical protein
MAIVYWQMMGSKILKNAWWKMGYDWFNGEGDNNNNDNTGDNNNIGDFDDEYDIGNNDEDKSDCNNEYDDNKSDFDDNVEETET